MRPAPRPPLQTGNVLGACLLFGAPLFWGAIGCSTLVELFPAGDEVGSATGGASGAPFGYGGGGGLGGNGEIFPAAKGDATLLELNTDAPCPDDISFTDDLLEMVFDSSDDTLLTSRRESRLSPWSPAEPILGPDAPGFDSGAEISGDGLTLWWHSSRPDGTAPASLWFSTRATRTSPWAAATQALDLDGPAEEAFPTITEDGLVLFFMTDRDIYETTRESLDSPWSPPTPISVNTARADTDPQISADGLTLYFSSTRLGGQGSTDLYVATRPSRDANFGEPEPLLELNTALNEGDPWVSTDGSLLVFFRGNITAGDCDFFSVEL